MQRGFSLVELIVTVGIGALLLIAVTSAMLAQESGQVQLRQSLEASEVENDVRLIIGNSDSCRVTLFAAVPSKIPPDNPLPATPLQLMEIRADDGTPNGAPAVVAPRDYNNLIRLENFELTRVLKPPGNPLPGIGAVGGRWQYDLTINFSPLSGSASIRPRRVELYVDVDGSTGEIVGCVGKVMQPSYNCRTQSAFVSGTSVSVTCDNVPGGGYRVVSCGMLDSNPDKNDWRRMVPKPASEPNGCLCYDHASSSLECRALCCRY